MKSKFFVIVPAVFRGIGQIMLQENGWTGVLFLAGIFYGSYIAGIAALLAAFTGTLTAKLLRYDEEQIERGLYGFSATLIGVALTFYFKPIPMVWLAIIVGSMLSAVVQRFFILKHIPGFTLPFILITWIALYFFHHAYLVENSAAMGEVFQDEDDFMACARGFGEIIFQGSKVAGILFFLGVFINKPIAALYGVAGAVLSAWLSVKIGEPSPAIHMGLFSFNAVLCAITFSAEKPRAGIFAVFAVSLSVLIDVGMLNMGCFVLTFPFVIATWITMLLQRLLPASWR